MTVENGTGPFFYAHSSTPLDPLYQVLRHACAGKAADHHILVEKFFDPLETVMKSIQDAGERDRVRANVLKLIKGAEGDGGDDAE